VYALLISLSGPQFASFLGMLLPFNSPLFFDAGIMIAQPHESDQLYTFIRDAALLSTPRVEVGSWDELVSVPMRSETSASSELIVACEHTHAYAFCPHIHACR